MTKCWICGNTATTSEHKIKHSDLKRVHGSGEAFTKANLYYKNSDDCIVRLQGSKSRHVKYTNVLCAKCNNERSQPFDQAYDSFINYIEANCEELLNRRQINFRKVFGDTWYNDHFNLHKYFVKCFGCRIANAKGEVPKAFKQILDDQKVDDQVIVCFSVNEDKLCNNRDELQTLGIGHLIHNEPISYERRYMTANYYRWLIISYWYNWGPYGPMGESWCHEKQFLCLGSYTKADSKVQVRRENGSLFTWPGIE